MFELTAGGHDGDGGARVRAVVSARGASLRALRVDGVELICSTLDPTPPLSAGTVLVPWPNRVDGASWVHDGRRLELDVTEQAAGNAIHGLLADHDYTLLERGESWLELAAPVAGHAGYPFELQTELRYELSQNGITATHRIRNSGDAPAPVALGVHPYLRVGDWPVDELRFSLPANAILPLDERHFPGERRSVRGAAESLRAGRRVAEIVSHACFTELERSDGRLHAELIAPDGRGARLWADPDFGYVQIYVTPDFPTDAGYTTAIAIEPMTAPPNALRSGEGLRWLAPGEAWELSWGIQAIQAL
ncbi:aldose 1-epimerase [Microterricola gilva]|uniref:Aldose 1-epimerase n=1 Tax=Microterricola gilva TaxID=393267 RepID=A0A4Q8ARF2_9MICO|nr:aldose 1-epimerase family protein [Microterricola gilva]RZU66811.1 aldose 1-epimerase [Microterricola gilva]